MGAAAETVETDARVNVPEVYTEEEHFVSDTEITTHTDVEVEAPHPAPETEQLPVVAEQDSAATTDIQQQTMTSC